MFIGPGGLRSAGGPDVVRVAVVVAVVVAGGAVGTVGAASAGGWNLSRGVDAIRGRCASCFAASSVFPSRHTVPLLVTLVTSTKGAEPTAGEELALVFDVVLIMESLRADNLSFEVSDLETNKDDEVDVDGQAAATRMVRNAMGADHNCFSLA